MTIPFTNILVHLQSDNRRVRAYFDDRIPPLNLNDGPQGYRSGGTTCWPSAMTVGATFDVDLALKWGQAMGKEFFDKATQIST